MMKLSDVKTATALIIQGYLRANRDDSLYGLAQVLSAIRQECEDWQENLTSEHMRPDGTWDDQD